MMRKDDPMSYRSISHLASIVTVFALAFFPSADAGAGDLESEDFAYGFYRTVEGQVLLSSPDENAEPLEVEPNYPVMTGDRLWVTDGARLEAVLPDKSILRAGERTDLFLGALAGSADSDGVTETVFRVLEGEILLTAGTAAPTGAQARIDTHNARSYLDLPGEYRLITDGESWTQIVVREGFAEVTTDRGSVVARPGDSVEISGQSRVEVRVASAGPLDELESWGRGLAGDQIAVSGYVDDGLAYAAAPLADAGYWVSISGRKAWRPRVRVGWRPFTDGWWTYTPSGLSWVAYEPWGWITSHYGAWDYVSGYGWIWFPGTVYSPAWVYWYWGPTHTAWIPAGYYSRFYGPRFGAGFRFGVYGWAGGYWDTWGHWTFCPTRYFGHRSYRSHWRSGHEMSRDHRLRAVPRGVITTDTRDLTPRRWGKPTEIVSALERRHQGPAGVTRSLGDVSSFVERRTELPDNTKRVVFTTPTPTTRPLTAAGPTTRSAGRRDDVTTSPWRVERPETVRSPGRRTAAPAIAGRSGSQTGTDWELIERLRRFENKQKTSPDGPRALERENTTSGGLGAPSRRELPTRRILDDVRARYPQGIQERRNPALTPRALGRPQTNTPSTDRSVIRTPETRRPTPPASRMSAPPRPQNRPSSIAKPSARPSPPRSVGSGASRSERSVRSSGGSGSQSRPKSSTASSARKRGG
jgi:hypothetical protein